ncbi:hypothetical protein FHU10_1244 [Serratia fonticola]|uniref:Lipoprotein n=1 Tax=Serratia fonticola TaxID=47917 RepID=A0A559T2G4_SERFO|nr:hypothetical protein FHU09_1207 [Serratia fonticola]TVZ68788.1 hypothetical protein FHU10_1244 [Serratia fonticola]
MHSKNRPVVVLTACLIVTACSNSAPHVIAPPLQLPGVLTASCPVPPFPDDDSADAAFVTLKQMYDIYATCAGRHVELVDFIGKRHHEP